MKMSLLLAVSSLCVFSFSQAEINTASDFDSLKQVYAQANTPTEADVTVWYSGMCFYSWGRENASIFAGISKPNDGLKFFTPMLFGSGQPIILAASEKARLENHFEQTLNDVSKVQLSNGSLSSETDCTSCSPNQSVTTRAKMSGNSIITEVLNSAQGIVAYCEYNVKL